MLDKRLKEMMDIVTDKGYFYNPCELLDYDRPLNFVNSSRSVGKSTSIALLCLLDYLINKNPFCYIRRTQDELNMTAGGFFNDAVTIINEKTNYRILGIRYRAGFYEIADELDEDGNPQYNGELCGMAVALSLEDKVKSGKKLPVRFCVWDEFIPDDDTRYLGSKNTPDKEYHKMVSLYVTLDRDVGHTYLNKVRFIMLGNTLTTYNPIYIKLGIPNHVYEGTHFIRPKGEMYACEMLSKVDATSDIENSFGYKMSDDYYKRYAYTNEGRDTNEYVVNIPKYTYLYTIQLYGKRYGIAKTNEVVYICKPRGDHKVISLGETAEDMWYMITQWRSNPLTKYISEAYHTGKLRFYSGEAKQALLKFLDFS